jgi:hypothetical protein
VAAGSNPTHLKGLVYGTITWAVGLSVRPTQGVFPKPSPRAVADVFEAFVDPARTSDVQALEPTDAS